MLRGKVDNLQRMSLLWQLRPYAKEYITRSIRKWRNSMNMIWLQTSLSDGLDWNDVCLFGIHLYVNHLKNTW